MSSPICDPKPDFYYCQTVSGLLMWGTVSDKRIAVVWNCYWPSPAQSFLGLSPVGLATIFYSLRFDTPPTWRARPPYLYPPGTGWPFIPPSTGFPFRRLLRLAALRWRYSTPPPHIIQLSTLNLVSLITSRHVPCRKHRSSVACVSVACRNVFT
jgi:hypothetical protein